MRFDKKDALAMGTFLVIIGLFIFVTVFYIPNQLTPETTEQLNPACLKQVAEEYCQETHKHATGTTKHGFYCIISEDQRNNTIELTRQHSFLPQEERQCITLKLNFRETGR